LEIYVNLSQKSLLHRKKQSVEKKRRTRPDATIKGLISEKDPRKKEPASTTQNAGHLDSRHFKNKKEKKLPPRKKILKGAKAVQESPSTQTERTLKKKIQGRKEDSTGTPEQEPSRSRRMLMGGYERGNG